MLRAFDFRLPVRELLSVLPVIAEEGKTYRHHRHESVDRIVRTSYVVKNAVHEIISFGRQS